MHTYCQYPGTSFHGILGSIPIISGLESPQIAYAETSHIYSMRYNPMDGTWPLKVTKNNTVCQETVISCHLVHILDKSRTMLYNYNCVPSNMIIKAEIEVPSLIQKKSSQLLCLSLTGIAPLLNDCSIRGFLYGLDLQDFWQKFIFLPILSPRRCRLPNRLFVCMPYPDRGCRQGGIQPVVVEAGKAERLYRADRPEALARLQERPHYCPGNPWEAKDADKKRSGRVHINTYRLELPTLPLVT